MPVFADLSAPHDIDLTIGRNDGLAPAADMAAALRNAVAVALTDNYAAALDSSFAEAGDNSPSAAIHSSVAAGIDNCEAVGGNYVPAAAGTGVGLQAGYILVAGVVLDAWVAAGWVPDERDADENHCGDSAPGRARPLMPASRYTRPAGAEIAPLLSSLSFPRNCFCSSIFVLQPKLRIRMHVFLDLQIIQQV